MKRRDFLAGGLALSALASASAMAQSNRFVAVALGLSRGAVAGLTPTVHPIAPNIQFHAGKSTATLRAAQTCTASLATNGAFGTLTVSALSGYAVVEGQAWNDGAGHSCKIIKWLGTGTCGSNGTYLVDLSATVASTTWTSNVQQTATINDLFSNCNLNSADGNGFIVKTYPDGRKSWLLHVPVNYQGQWMVNTTFAGLDTYNMAWQFVGRVLGPTIQNAAIGYLLGVGAQSLGGAFSGPWMGIQTNASPMCHNNSLDWNQSTAAQPANMGKMFLPPNLHVWGCATASANGVNAGTPGTAAMQISVNEQDAVGAFSLARVFNKTGLTIGCNPTVAAGSNINAGWCFVEIFEMSGWTTGQFGTNTQMPARLTAAQSAAMTNYGIVPFLDNLIVAPDSRTANGATGGSSGATNDNSGVNLAVLLTEPGAANAVPKTMRVLTHAFQGKGIGWLRNRTNTVCDHAQATQTPLNVANKFSGGRNIIHLMSGINDTGGTTLWPTTAGAYGSSAIADDLYDGAGYSASFTGTISASATALSTTAMTGAMYIGSLVTYTGQSPGVGIDVVVSAGTSYTMSQKVKNAQSAVAMTGQLNGYKHWIEQQLVAGWEVVVAGEPGTAASETAGTTRLRSRLSGIAADVLADLGAGYNGKVKYYDMTAITDGGAAVMGAGYVGGSAANRVFRDTPGLHFTKYGSALMAYGGDDPTKGAAYQVQH